MSELAIGQLWRDRYGNGREIVALGPEYLMFRTEGFRPTAFAHCGVEHFKSLPGNALVKPKHELWVNVWRGGNGEVFLRHGPSRVQCDDQAMLRSDAVRLACLNVEFTEGEGLYCPDGCRPGACICGKH